MSAQARVVKTVFVLGSMMLAAGPRRVAGQNFTTKVRAYQQRAVALRSEIAAVSVTTTYCDPAGHEADHQRLLEIQKRFNLLNANWNSFKKDNPNDTPDFWTSNDQQIIDDTRVALARQLERWEASTVLCDSTTKTTPVDTTRPPPLPRRDSVPGLKRPELPQVKVPAETTFCSQEEKIRWIQQVISPLLNQLTQATNPARDYEDAVDKRLSAAKRAKSADTATLKDELTWAKEAHQALDDTYDAIRAIVDNSKVIDCTPHVTLPQPIEQPDSTRRAPKDGAPPPSKENPSNTPRNDPRAGMATPSGGPPRGYHLAVGGGAVDYWKFFATENDEPDVTRSSAKQTVGAFSLSAGKALKNWDAQLSFRWDRRKYRQTFGALPAVQNFHGTLADYFAALEAAHYFIASLDWAAKGIVGLGWTFDVLDAYGDAGSPVERKRLSNVKSVFGIEVERSLSGPFWFDVRSTCWTGGNFTHDGDLSVDAQLRLKYYLGHATWRRNRRVGSAPEEK